MYAEVIVDISSDELNKGFSYRVPEEMEDKICIGAFVKIPFGKTSRKGYVISLSEDCDYDKSQIREISELIVGSETAETKMVNLAAWMSEHYSCNFIQALKTAIPARKKIKSRTKKSELINDAAEDAMVSFDLTCEQKKVYDEIKSEWEEENRPCLIHGVTGSGKTYIYMRLIQDMIRQGKQAIVLIPEISLTYQTVNRFIDCFGDKVSFLNSRMSQGEKFDNLKAAKSGKISVMIGPRSALFTPFSKLGLIIIDEEHEESYRSELTPRYHARETAIKRAQIEGAHVVLGSATPSVESYYYGKKGLYKLLTLEQHFGAGSCTDVECVDMREELKNGNNSFLSEKLRYEIHNILDNKQQAMLFLNRRGYRGFISCRNCGHVFKCPHCDVSLTEHNNGKLVCHYCGYTTAKKSICPECGSGLIGGMKIGTEQVEEVIKREYPEAKVLRMDMDTTSGKEGHAKILAEFASGDADILIGTQMIVKGHDYPNVSLVGILMADLSLNDSDFRAAEKTFQLITQAVGRTGRGNIPGKAVIQTYDPDNYSIVAAGKRDYLDFYNQEICFREMMNYPPAGFMMAVLGNSGECQLLEKGMDFISKYLKMIDKNNRLEIIGPAPLAIRKIKDIYREVLYIRASRYDVLLKTAEAIQKYIEINSGFDNINISFDYNI